MKTVEIHITKVVQDKVEAEQIAATIQTSIANKPDVRIQCWYSDREVIQKTVT